jgi:hypothetical protein
VSTLKHALRRSLTAAALAVVTAATCTTPASATPSQGYISGSGTVTDDWYNEGTLSMYNYRTTYAVGLWQRILYAEGAYYPVGGAGSIVTPFQKQWIDCDFGSGTRIATQDLQNRWGLEADGYVGPLTLGRADNNLVLIGDYNTATQLVEYRGRAHTVQFLRVKSNGAYQFRRVASDGVTDGGWNTASYSTPGPC